MHLTDKAIENTSKLLRLRKSVVSDFLDQELTGLDDVTQYFFLRSLSNQSNLTDSSFHLLQEDDKLMILKWYLARHISLDLGNSYLSYPERIDASRQAKQGARSSSLYLYTLHHKNNAEYLEDFSSDCLFPKRSNQDRTEFSKVWSSVASYWIKKGSSEVRDRKIPSFLAICYGIDPSSVMYRHFSESIKPEMLSEAIKYTPVLTRKMTWSNYVSVANPLLKPLPCVSPLGFDYMAFILLEYIDDVRPIGLWS